MDALEPMMDERHLHERIRSEARVFIDESLEIRHGRHDLIRAARRVDHIAILVLERSAKYSSKAGLVALELRLSSDNMVVGENILLAGTNR